MSLTIKCLYYNSPSGTPCPNSSSPPGFTAKPRIWCRPKKSSKLKALTIEHLFNPIQISEETGYPKPNGESYLAIERQYPHHQYLYVGDNPKKDFVTPNKLGWMTYGLRNRGNNVHPQLDKANQRIYMPQLWLNKLSELIPRVSR